MVQERHFILIGIAKMKISLDADQIQCLPKFIIGGGMKCGTTSLHLILNQHPEIFIPQEESHFFTIDDIEQNPDFFLRKPNEWRCWNFEDNFKEYLLWYLDFFKPSHPNQIIGEDCVSYLSSSKAPARIASILPNVKLIFMLRDPVARTYSQYWHWVKTYRAIYSFEDTLQFAPGHIIQRSLYQQHIERYLKYFDLSQIKIIIFEEFVQNTQSVIDEVCEFIGLQDSIDVGKINTHTNKALVPRNVSFQLAINRLLKTAISGHKYLSYHLPNPDPSFHPKFFTRLNSLFQELNLSQNIDYPSMDLETKIFLEKYFSKENIGLSNLIQTSVEKYWKYMNNS